MFFRFFQPLPHGEIKIPWPANICFEDAPAAVVDLAVQTGETAAKVEQVQIEQSQQADTLETLESRIKWTQDDVDSMWRQIGELRTAVEELTARVDILEAGPEPEPEPEPKPEEPEPEPTEIVPPAESPKTPEKAKKHSWSLW